MKKPNLFIPGFPKCGTSSLHFMLTQHPEITDGVRKEPHTYSWEERYRNRSKYFKEVYENKKSRYILDSSTTYAVSKVAIERILTDTPEAKFVVVLRDPINRIISHYNWLSKLGLVNLPFEEEIENHRYEKFNYKNHYNGNYKAYLDFSLYGAHLEYLISKTKNNQLFFVFFEELTTNWKRISRELGEFLDLDFTSIELEKLNVTATTKRKEPIKKKNKLVIWRKKLINVLTDKPRNHKIKNPIFMEVSRKEVENFLYPCLEQDLKKVAQLGLYSDSWSSKI